MEYLKLEEVGEFRVRYDGAPLDIHSLATLYVNLQQIIDNVTYTSLSLEKRWPIDRAPFRPSLQRKIIRAEISELKFGSLFEILHFYIPAFLAHPDVRAILTGIAANIIYSIIASKRHEELNDVVLPEGDTEYQMPLTPDVGRNIKSIVKALARNGGGEVEMEYRTREAKVLKVRIIARK